ncbi:cell division protein SepF [Enterococcus sp. HY326]|uniref:cell division protein SepF n=1 Tax=Enterococcus sp. HY326 TaxID=2971265 RepID=UPI00223FFF65|nr:cell division protein SepF [Enterococcus sp. HY326]
MALFNKKFANFFGLLDEEEYEEDVRSNHEESSFQAREQHQVEMPQAVNDPVRETRFSENIQKAMKESDDKQVERSRQMQQEAPKLVSLSNNSNRGGGGGNGTKKTGSAKNLGKITICEPRAYSEAMTIAKRIIAGESVLINFYSVEELQARRIVDFLTGTVYAQDGDIQRVGDEIFLCTPPDVEIDKSIAQSLAESNFFE